jgi:AcrR family transcriptional regulator
VVNHAGSKAQLVVGLLVEDLSRAMDAPIQGPLPTGRAGRLAGRFRAFFELYAERPDLARRTILEVAFAPTDAFAPYLALTLRFVAELASWLEAEEPLRPHVPSWVAARVLFDTYIGVVVLYLREERPDPEAGLSALQAAFVPLVSVLFVDE